MNVQNRITELRRQQEIFNQQVEDEITAVKNSDKIKRDLTNFGRQRARLVSRVKVATYNGWKELGFSVRAGEKAHDVDGVKVFHVTQTTAHGY